MIKRLVTLCLLACSLPVLAAGPVPHWTPPTEAGVGWDSGDYAYDDSGNIAKIGQDKFGYDGVNRLAGATVNAHNVATTQNFSYDRYGNLLHYSTFIVRGAAPPEIGGATFTVSPATNRLATTYDDAGNQTRDGDVTYRWDPTGAMTELEGSVAHERYVYDANNERVAMISLDGTREVVRRWTWRDQANKVAREAVETVGSDRWTEARDYVYRSGALLASFETATATVAERHYHTDHLGTPRLLTDAGRRKLSIESYLPFGGRAPGGEFAYVGFNDRMRFTGHERDGDRSPYRPTLDYMHARYYSPDGGRFLSPDPTWDSADLNRPQSWDRYTYAVNNPIRFTDPDGKVAVAAPVAIGLVVGGIVLTAYLATPTPEGKTHAQAMADSAMSLYRAVARSMSQAEPVVYVREDTRRRRDQDRRIIGQTMERVFEAAPQVGAKPLFIDADLGVVEGSRQAVLAAAASGARIFDIGYDPNRKPSAPYEAERAALISQGYTPHRSSYAIIQGQQTTVWEWTKPAK